MYLALAFAFVCCELGDVPVAWVPIIHAGVGSVQSCAVHLFLAPLVVLSITVSVRLSTNKLHAEPLRLHTSEHLSGHVYFSSLVCLIFKACLAGVGVKSSAGKSRHFLPALRMPFFAA